MTGGDGRGDEATMAIVFGGNETSNDSRAPLSMINSKAVVFKDVSVIEQCGVEEEVEVALKREAVGYTKLKLVKRGHMAVSNPRVWPVV